MKRGIDPANAVSTALPTALFNKYSAALALRKRLSITGPRLQRGKNPDETGKYLHYNWGSVNR